MEEPDFEEITNIRNSIQGNSGSYANQILLRHTVSIASKQVN